MLTGIIGGIIGLAILCYIDSAIKCARRKIGELRAEKWVGSL